MDSFLEPRYSTNATSHFTSHDSPGEAWTVKIPCAGNFSSFLDCNMMLWGRWSRRSFVSQVGSSPNGVVRRARIQGSVQAGNHFRFARQKAVQKRHCLLLFSPIHVILAKIYFRTHVFCNKRRLFRCRFCPQRSPKRELRCFK